MKIALTGKGGVGKSTIAAALAISLAENGGRVVALDADPDANLASSLGIPRADQDKIVTIAEQIDLIEERTGAKVGQYGQVFKLNPEVSDVTDRYAYDHRGVSLLVLGAVRNGGGGCACPENTFIRALVTDLVLFRDETLIMDMEAGIEHLGRGTASGVDEFIVVIEPGARSIQTYEKVKQLALDLGVNRVRVVANKVRDEEDEEFIREHIKDDLLGFIHYNPQVIDADRRGSSPYDISEQAVSEIKQIKDRIDSDLANSQK